MKVFSKQSCVVSIVSCVLSFFISLISKYIICNYDMFSFCLLVVDILLSLLLVSDLANCKVESHLVAFQVHEFSLLSCFSFSQLVVGVGCCHLCVIFSPSWIMVLKHNSYTYFTILILGYFYGVFSSRCWC